MIASNTPQKKMNVPAGYIFIHEKWQGSSIAQEIHRKSKGCCYEDLGVVDFFPSTDCPVIYLNEADLLCTSSNKSKVKSLAKEYPKCKSVVIMVLSPSTHEFFKEMQKVAVIDHSLTVLPITSSYGLPDLLIQMIRMETTSPVNPFKFKKKKTEVHSDRDQQISLLSTIPGVGETNAKKLLRVFGTITAISTATYSELAGAIGNSVAKSVLDFFNGGVMTVNN
ncbi:Fanconi anemia core complex-associated protein 24-like [Hetaerina americana]|uniref:Fanconi anemia core complex-associated protein 24-like n=1 Tax=Hetaerina americana TaxID=62018 RepID=UPI003A7F1282